MTHRKTLAFLVILIGLGHQSDPSTNQTHSISNNTTINSSCPRNSSCHGNRVDVCNSTPTTFGIVYSVFLAAIIVFSYVGNAMVILTVLYAPSMKTQIGNRFLISLAVSGITSASILPIKISMALANGGFCFSSFVCKLTASMNILFDSACITSILCISIDRYIAIINPFNYSSVISKTRVNLTIFLIWVYAAIWSSMGTFDWQFPERIAIHLNDKAGLRRCTHINIYFFYTVYTAVFIVPLVGIGFIYLKIFNEARKHNRAIRALQVDTSCDGCKQRKKTNVNFKSALAVSMVYGAFVGCWLPNYIISLHALGDSDWWLHFKAKFPTLFFTIYYLFAEILPALNSVLNPLVYAISNRSFRAAAKETASGFWRRSVNWQPRLPKRQKPQGDSCHQTSTEIYGRSIYH